jgi:hypothetical protein
VPAAAGGPALRVVLCVRVVLELVLILVLVLVLGLGLFL